MQIQGRELRNRASLRPSRWYNDFIDINKLFITELTEPKEPNSFKEAVENENSEKWKRAMNEEIKALLKNQVWELTDAPKNRRIVDNKWTFKIKRDENGNIKRFKARLVARGFSQQEGIDYHETFSPVVRFDSIRAILAIAAI
ncbi:uncharacterized mitochondrial protein AtMg00820-like [Venturia canescens]|uniref:uncharacterized mitochondrial protein AtMg00820-like n=1 Tax=Venturia canescens TaxID=32260 RepID=UPI001C9C900A|nr:uncharacterized mitochondrial protein AtMg00820-like [Venturia canescens]